MDIWKNIQLFKEEEEGITADIEEVCEREAFLRTLAGKLWTDNGFNSRAFQSTMLGAWKLKNPVEVQELNKNLFLFHFATKRDLESVLKNGPWSFDQNLLVLRRISGEEQPSDLSMHFGTFWVRVYELPLMLRYEKMARKLRGILREFEELDSKEAHRNGRFLRIKVTIDLKKPLKRGTVVRFKEKNLRVHFKYERLPTFCFVCGKLGHQLKDCETVWELSEEGFEDIEEQDLAFGAWSRASPLPKIHEEVRKKESNSSSCSKSLFNISSSQSKCETASKGKEIEEGVVEQIPSNSPDIQNKEAANQKSNNQEERRIVRVEIPKAPTHGKATLEIEAMAESFGAVDISNVGDGMKGTNQEVRTKRRKWTRRQTTRKDKAKKVIEGEVECGKRNLVDVMILDGTVESCGKGEKKPRGQEEEGSARVQLPEMVLEAKHRLQQ